MKRKCINSGLFIGIFIVILFSSCVKNDVTNLSLNLSKRNFIIGQTDSIIASVTVSGDISKFPITWTSSNNNVVTVKNGKITGVSNGLAVITAKSGSMSANCEVTVNNEIAIVLDNGHLVYYGDAFATGISNFFQLAIAGPSDTLYFFINAPITSTTQLALGEYKVLTTLNTISDLIPYSFIAGEVYNGEKDFSWYVGGIESPITDGDFNITSVNNNNYTMELNLKDGYGNTIYGSFQGTIIYHDLTSSLVPAANKMKINYQNPFLKRFLPF